MKRQLCYYCSVTCEGGKDGRIKKERRISKLFLPISQGNY